MRRLKHALPAGDAGWGLVCEYVLAREGRVSKKCCVVARFVTGRVMYAFIQ